MAGVVGSMESNVEQVILAVYQPGRDENARREALAQLQAFSARPEAWGVLFSLLDARSKEVQFYSSIMLYAKVQKEWSRQPDSAREDIYNRAFAVVQGYVRGGGGGASSATASGDGSALERNAAQRLCLMLARIVVQAPQALETYTGAAGGLLAIGLGTSADPKDAGLDAAARERALFISMQLLMDLPEEREALVSGRRDSSSGLEGGGGGTTSTSTSSGLAAPGSPRSSAINRGVLSLDPEGIDSKLVSATPRVIEAVTLVIQSQAGAKHHARALECLQRWVPVAIDLLALSQHGLLLPILSALHGCEDAEVVEAASRALETCVKKNSRERDNGEPENQGTVNAFDETIRALLASATRLRLGPDSASTHGNGNGGSGPTAASAQGAPRSLSVDGEEDESIALSLSRVVTAVAEHEVDRIVGGKSAQHLQLVGLVMALTGHASLNVAIHTLNFWLLLQDVPVQERHESLRETRYEELLGVLLRQAALAGPEAASGADADVDYACQAFRDGGDGVRELLLVVYFALGPRFLDAVFAQLTAPLHASDWAAFEAALFALEAVAPELAGRDSGQRSVASGGPRAAATRERLLAVLTALPGLPMIATNGATLKATVRCMGAYAKVLAGMDCALIERALECIVRALTLCGGDADKCVAKAAGGAFQRVCLACRLQLAMHPDGVKHLAVAVENAVHAGAVPVAARADCVQGFARVASCMKLDQCTETLALVLNPGFERLRGAVDRADKAAVAGELKVLCTAVKFVDLPHHQQQRQHQTHPVAGILQGTLPILELIYASPPLRADPDVVDVLYLLISTSFVCAKDVLAPHLESLLQSAVRQFRASWSPCCVTCVGKAVEIFQSPNDQPGFVTLFNALTAAMVDAVRDGHAAENPEVATAYFDTALLFLLFCPDALFSAAAAQPAVPPAAAQEQPPAAPSSSTTADTLLQIAAQVMTTDESASLRSLLVFLVTLVAKLNDGPIGAGSAGSLHAPLERFKPAFDNALRQTGPTLVRVMLLGLASTASPAQLSKLAGCLGDFANHYPGPIQEWTYNALVNEPAVFAGLSDANKEAFVAVVGQLHLSKTKARDVFMHVGKICRNTDGFGPNEMQDFLNQVQSALNAIVVANSTPPRLARHSHNTPGSAASPVIVLD